MTTQTFRMTYASPEEEAALTVARNDPFVQGVRRQFRANGRGDTPLAWPLEKIRALFIRLASRPKR